MTRTVQLSQQTELAIRKLRLWHWQGVKHHRDAEKFFTEMRSTKNMVASARAAAFHMKQVQFLNDFFDVGDNAFDDEKRMAPIEPRNEKVEAPDTFVAMLREMANGIELGAFTQVPGETDSVERWFDQVHGVIRMRCKVDVLVKQPTNPPIPENPAPV